MSRDEFIEYVETLHLQNLSGREDFHKAFQLGIGAAFDEIKQLELTAVVQAKPEKVFDIHSCINEICYAANKDSCLFNDNINNNSFRFRIKKAIDKLIYAK
jgi:hypothetical protein